MGTRWPSEPMAASHTSSHISKMARIASSCGPGVSAAMVTDRPWRPPVEGSYRFGSSAGWHTSQMGDVAVPQMRDRSGAFRTAGPLVGHGGPMGASANEDVVRRAYLDGMNHRDMAVIE